jgi:hypothetical protein
MTTNGNGQAPNSPLAGKSEESFLYVTKGSAGNIVRKDTYINKAEGPHLLSTHWRMEGGADFPFAAYVSSGGVEMLVQRFGEPKDPEEKSSIWLGSRFKAARAFEEDGPGGRLFFCPKENVATCEVDASPVISEIRPYARPSAI